MKSKTTKRALLSSCVALMLCFSMLLGTTYAWFTDSVTSANNIIKSGTLDVEMYWADGTMAVPAVDSTDWTDASKGAIFNYDKWEPGYTEVRHIKIANVGTLALKYGLDIVPTGDASKLVEVIDVYFLDPAQQIADRSGLASMTAQGTLKAVLGGMPASASGTLEARDSVIVTLALKMQEEAGNDYQDLSIGSDFAVKLFATQLESEEDSFDETYDSMATVDDEAELRAALAGDYDLIELGGNIALASGAAGFEIPAGKEVTIDLKGYTISQVNEQTAAYALISNKGTLTIKDSVSTGKISYEDKTAYTKDPGWASNTIRNEGTLNVEGGTIENVTSDEVMNYGYPHAIDVYQGSVTNIKGGTVKSINYDAIRMFCNSETLATTVNISGGTIYNRVSFQDPAAARAGYGILNISGGNFISTDDVTANVRLLNFSSVGGNMKATVTGGTFDKGFKTQDIVDLGVTQAGWLTMTGGSVPAKDNASLTAAITSGASEIIVAEGTYTFPATELKAGQTLVCEEGTVFEGQSSLNIEGATVIGATFSNEDGYAVRGDINGTFKDCTFESSEALRWCYTKAGDTIVFENCVFKTDFRGIHFDTMNGDVLFKNCEINGFNAYSGDGKATFEKCTFGNDESAYNGLNIYANTELKDCTFNYVSGKTNFIDMEGTGKTLTITNCTATLDGAAANIDEFIGGSKLAQNTVIIDDVTQ